MKIPFDPPTGPKMSDYAAPTPCTWCEGCGDYGIWAAVKQALVTLKIYPHEVAMAFDVGCHGNMSDKILGYRIHGLHGRVIPLAAGIKLADPRLHVLAFGGDGATFSEGVNHLVHGIRSNYPIVFVLHNNENYGLTTGQASALTWQDQKMNSSPNGIPERTLNPMDFVFSLQPTFVARGFSGDIPMMHDILVEAMQHRGFAFVDILQACPTYNKFATHDWLLERCVDVTKDGKWDPTDVVKARKTAIDTSKQIACGVLYKEEETEGFYERLVPRQGVETMPVDEVKVHNVEKFLKEFV